MERSALDDVVHRGNLRLAGIRPERPHDWQQGGPECLERLLRFPDVEYLDLPIVLECDVVEPTGVNEVELKWNPRAMVLAVLRVVGSVHAHPLIGSNANVHPLW